MACIRLLGFIWGILDIWGVYVQAVCLPAVHQTNVNRHLISNLPLDLASPSDVFLLILYFLFNFFNEWISTLINIFCFVLHEFSPATLIDWLTELFFDWKIDWLIGLVDRLIDWLNEWMIWLSLTFLSAPHGLYHAFLAG